jgi:hypothetical protein
MFSTAKTVIIDDIFSSMDKHTSTMLLERIALGGSDLMKGRTVILTTKCKLGTWARSTKLIVSMTAPAKIRIIQKQKYIMDFLDQHTHNKDSDQQDDTSISAMQIGDDERYGDDEAVGMDTLVEGAGSQFIDEDYFDEGSVMRDSIFETDDGGSQQTSTITRDLAYATYFTACGGWFFWVSAVVLTVLTRISSLGECYWLKEGNTCQTTAA